MPLPTPSARARATAESATLAITARVAQLRAAGHDVVSLAAGEPDAPTPTPIAEAGIDAIRRGDVRYTAAAGTPELRRAAAAWFARTYGVDFGADGILVCGGAKPALHMALLTLVDRGDRVLIPAPYWVSYPDLVKIADGVPVALAPVPDQGFVHTGAQVAAAAAEHGAKGIILCSPNNPSGAVPTRAQVQDVVRAAIAADLWILSDEIYGTMLYDGAEHVSPASLPEAAGRVLVVNGGTKSHSMTGWRVGFLAGPAPLIAAAARIQSQVLGNACTISQHAARVVCEQDFTDELFMRMAEFDRRRRYLVDEIPRIEGLALTPPRGAFYALVDARGLCARMGLDDVALCMRLLEEHHLAVVPGSAFAIPGFVRISFAAAMPQLQKAVQRLRAFAGGTS